MADLLNLRLSDHQRIMVRQLCGEQSSYYGHLAANFYQHDETQRRNCIRLARTWKEIEQLFRISTDIPESDEEE